jgi:hypothetical protein
VSSRRSGVGRDALAWIDPARLVWLRGDAVELLALERADWRSLACWPLAAPVDAWDRSRDGLALAIGETLVSATAEGLTPRLRLPWRATALAAVDAGALIGAADGSIAWLENSGEHQPLASTDRPVHHLAIWPRARPNPRTQLWTLCDRQLGWQPLGGERIELAHRGCPYQVLHLDHGGIAWAGTEAAGLPRGYDEPEVVRFSGAPPQTNRYRIWGDSAFWPHVSITTLDADDRHLAIGMLIDDDEPEPGSLLWVHRHGRGYLDREYRDDTEALPICALALHPEHRGLAVAGRLEDRVTLDWFEIAEPRD